MEEVTKLAEGTSTRTRTTTVTKRRLGELSSNTNVVPSKRNKVDHTNVGKAKDMAPSTQQNVQSCKDRSCIFNSTKAGNMYDSATNIVASVKRVDEICQQIQKVLTSCFQLRHVDEKRTMNEYNKSFITDHYPNISKKTYIDPLVIQPLNPHESTCNMEEKNRDVKQTSQKFNARKGYDAEKTTAFYLLRMFELFKIPAFIIRSYVWNKMLCQDLVDVLKKELQNEMPGDGEQDMLVLLPSVGVLLIEVKSHPNKKIRDALKKSMKQLKKLVNCLAYPVLDLIVQRKLHFVKVASFPNCSRNIFAHEVCGTCSRHLITADDFTSLEKLHSWYEKLIQPLKDNPCDFDSELVEGMVARLIGPLSKVTVKRLPKVIEETCTSIEYHGSAQQVKTVFQLNEEQRRISFQNPGCLWITGDPGTGKTVLALWKVQQILHKNKKHVIYLIAGNRDMMLIKSVKMKYESHLAKKTKNVTLRIESVESVCPNIQQWYNWKDLLSVIQTLTSENGDSYVSIVVDEFRLVSNDASGLPHKTRMSKEKLKLGNLQNLWIIQKPSCKTDPDFTILGLDFRSVHLEKIMRMSFPNVEFINRLLNNVLKVGHACDGPSPELYTMECICKKLQASDEPTCIPFLIQRLTEEVLSNSNKDLVVMTKMYVKVKKLLSQKHPKVVVCPAVNFTGCEKEVAIVDIRNEGSFGPNHNLTEALTRAKGLLVLIDVSCENAKEENRYLPKGQTENPNVNELLDKLYDTSAADIKRHPKVEFSEKEMESLRFEISLGLYRDEQEIHEIMRSVVTKKLLEKTLQQELSPIKKELEELKSSVSKLSDDNRETHAKLDSLLTHIKESVLRSKKM